MRPNYAFNTLFVRCYCLVISLAIGLGVAISVGEAKRFSSPSFIGPKRLVEWIGIPSYWTWAAIFFAYGVVLLLALGRHSAVHVLRVGIALYLFWALSFLGSVLTDPRASITGVVAYLVMAGSHLFLSDHLHQRGWEGC